MASVQAPASAQEGTAIVARPREVCESRSSKLVPPCSGPADQGRSNRDQEPGKFVHASQFRSRGAMTRVSRCADGVERGSLPPKKPMGTLEDSLLSNRPAACVSCAGRASARHAMHRMSPGGGGAAGAARRARGRRWPRPRSPAPPTGRSLPRPAWLHRSKRIRTTYERDAAIAAHRHAWSGATLTRECLCAGEDAVLFQQPLGGLVELAPSSRAYLAVELGVVDLVGLA